MFDGLRQRVFAVSKPPVDAFDDDGAVPDAVGDEMGAGPIHHHRLRQSRMGTILNAGRHVAIRIVRLLNTALSATAV